MNSFQCSIKAKMATVAMAGLASGNRMLQKIKEKAQLRRAFSFNLNTLRLLCAWQINNGLTFVLHDLHAFLEADIAIEQIGADVGPGVLQLLEAEIAWHGEWPRLRAHPV